MTDINLLKKNFQAQLKTSEDLTALEALQIKYLGRNGIVNHLFREVRALSKDKRKDYGKNINSVKGLFTKMISEKRAFLISIKQKKGYIDITLPGKSYPKGSLHIMTQAIEEIAKIFEKIGFIRLSYPEVEREYFAFEALNMPPGHPARDDFETFFVEGDEDKKLGQIVLSPHTSSGQVREMLRVGKPPIRMINIAKCYRPNWDATHAPMFYQFEGLCIDKDINITHLKGTVDYFAKEYFGPDREIRLRPFHFRFTEPSFEADITCGICKGKGEINGKKCNVCKSGWLELGGAGMVHPYVLRSGKIDPNVYSGWAFGFGPERCFMMKAGLADIRNLYDNDIRFLEQF